MSVKKTSILDGDEIKAITAELRVLIPGLAEIADRMGHDLEAGARLMSLKAKCTEARDKLGLSIKEVAQQLRVPQYRIKAAEAGRLSEIEPLIMTRYVALLGIGRWVRRWVAANEELAGKLGLVAAASKPSKKASRKKAVPQTKKRASSTRPAEATKAASDLDIDYEMYLECFAEDDDGGKRPKLSKERFARLSDEMMDLVNWENVEPLPLKEKRRMKELEYLLIG